MKLTTLRGYIIFAVILMATPVHAFYVDLEAGKWYLLSVPGEQSGSIEDLFRGELNAADYNKTWIVFSYGKSIQDYEKLSVTDVLQTGEAFWLIHYTNSSISFEVPEDFVDAPIALASACPSEGGCFEYDLPVGDDVSWSMIGSPFLESVFISDIKLVTSSGPCQAGCDINQAFEAGLSGNAFYLYSAATISYDPLVNDELLMAGEGHWFPTIIPSELQPAKLLIPNFCSS